MTIDQESMQMVQGTAAGGMGPGAAGASASRGEAYTASTPSTVKLSKIIACEIKVMPCPFACRMTVTAV